MTLLKYHRDSKTVFALQVDVSEWPSDAAGRRLAFGVVSPARDISVASKRERVMVSRSDCDEVAVDAAGRRLAVVVVSPERDPPVASKRERVRKTCGNLSA